MDSNTLTADQFTSASQLDSFSCFILQNRRAFTSTTAMTDDAREAVSLLLNNHEVLDLNKMNEALLPFIKQAIANEKRKIDAGVAVPSTDWDSWFERLSNGELQLNREFLPEVWRWTEEEILQAEIKFAQEAKQLSPNLQPLQNDY